MTEPSERDRALFLQARKAYHQRWLAAETFTGWDYGAAEMVEAIATARREERERRAWQPIETAPVDKSVLLYCPEREPISNRERIEMDYAHTSHGSHHAWATHWMPLPEPPAHCRVATAALEAQEPPK